MTFGLTSYTVLPYVSIAGGILAAALVYAFAWRGGLHATRFVLIGIGIAIALRSLITLFMTKGDYLVAQQAQIWMTGSLNGRGWDESAPIRWTLLLLLPAVLWAARAQRTVPSTTTRRPRSASGSARSGSGSSPSASSSPRWRPASRDRSTSWPARPADRPPHDPDGADPAALLRAHGRGDRGRRRPARPAALRPRELARWVSRRRRWRPVSIWLSGAEALEA
ncbi:Vitamin B12 import system permease protein BtuC [Streptomyces tanashiensis]